MQVPNSANTGQETAGPEGTHSPRLGRQSPGMGVDGPPLGGHRPRVGTSRPGRGGQSPRVGSSGPRFADQSPGMGAGGPPLGGGSPTVGGSRPRLGGGSPRLGGDGPDGGATPKKRPSPAPAQGRRGEKVLQFSKNTRPGPGQLTIHQGPRRQRCVESNSSFFGCQASATPGSRCQPLPEEGHIRRALPAEEIAGRIPSPPSRSPSPSNDHQILNSRRYFRQNDDLPALPLPAPQLSRRAMTSMSLRP